MYVRFLTGKVIRVHSNKVSRYTITLVRMVRVLTFKAIKRQRSIVRVILMGSGPSGLWDHITTKINIGAKVQVGLKHSTPRLHM